MKIAFITKRRYMSQDVILDRYGRLYEFPCQLAHLGHRVEGFCLSYRTAEGGTFDAADAVAGSLRWHAYNAGPALVAGLPGYMRAMLEQLRRFGPDVLLGSSDAVHVVLTQWLGARLGVPVVADLYDNYESFGLSRLPGLVPLYRRALRRSDAVVTVSETLSEFVSRLCPDQAVHTLESTIDPSRFRPIDRRAARRELGLPEDALLIGVAGSLNRLRGIDLVYRTLQRLWSRGRAYRLVLVGDVDPAVPPPEDSRVTLLGRLPHARMAAFHSALNVAVICLRDGAFGRYAFPQKAYEILACGTPLVAADVGALRKTLAGWPACLYQAEDVDSLAAALDRQMLEPVVPDLPIPTWADQGRRLEAILEQAVDGYLNRPGFLGDPH